MIIFVLSYALISSVPGALNIYQNASVFSTEDLCYKAKDAMIKMFEKELKSDNNTQYSIRCIDTKVRSK